MFRPILSGYYNPITGRTFPSQWTLLLAYLHRIDAGNYGWKFLWTDDWYILDMTFMSSIICFFFLILTAWNNNLTICILVGYSWATALSRTAAILPQSKTNIFISKRSKITVRCSPEVCTESDKKNKQGKQSNTQTCAIESPAIPKFSHFLFIP